MLNNIKACHRCCTTHVSNLIDCDEFSPAKETDVWVSFIWNYNHLVGSCRKVAEHQQSLQDCARSLKIFQDKKWRSLRNPSQGLRNTCKIFIQIFKDLFGDLKDFHQGWPLFFFFFQVSLVEALEKERLPPKSKSEPLLPLVRESRAVTGHGILTSRQKRWTQGRPNESSIENPVHLK